MIKKYKGTRLNILYSLIYVVATSLLVLIKISGEYKNQSNLIIGTYIVAFTLIALGFIKSYFIYARLSDNKIELLGIISKKEINVADIESIESDKTKNEVILITKENKKYEINLCEIHGSQRKEFQDRLLALSL